MDLKDRVVVVTGAGRGIGAAMCRTFAKAGAKLIVVSDLDETAARNVAEQIGSQAIFNRCDVASEDDVRQLVSVPTRASPSRADLNQQTPSGSGCGM